MPNLTIVDPCDSVDIEQAVPQLAADRRAHLPAAAPRARPDRARRVRLHLRTRQGQGAPPGRDVVFISTGLMTMRALAAAKALEADDVDVAVIHIPTIKPFDHAAIARAAEQRPARRSPWKTTPSSAVSPTRSRPA